MKTPVQIITLLLLYCTWFSAISQPGIRFNRLTREDGLSSDVIYDLHQDRNGFLWIATHKGLDRYDGYQFRHYRYNPDDSNSLSGNYVHCIKEDNNGLLWITNNNGLNSLDPVTGIIKRFAPSPATMPKDMNDIMLVNDSILLVTAISTAYVFNIHRHSFSEVKIQHTKDPTDLMHAKFLKDAKGNICLMDEFKRIDWEHNALVNLSGDNDDYAVGMDYDTRGNRWRFFVGTELLQTKTISGKPVHYPFTNKDIHATENTIAELFEDEDRMWICTDAGLVYYDYLQNQFYRYRQEPGNAASLSNNRIRCMLKDKKGLYWVGTFGGGVCYFNENTKFKNIAIDTGYNDENRKIGGLKALHSGRIIVGTMAGKKFMLERDKTLHELDYAKDFKTPALLQDIVREFTGRSITEFSSADSYLLRKHFKANSIRYPSGYKHSVTTQGLQNALMNSILLPFNKKLWIRYSGPRLYDGKKNHVLKPTINQFELLDNNHFLLATGNGLVEFDANTDSVIRTWLPQPGNPYSIGGTWISCIVPDGKGNYWIGTADAGLNYWNVKTDKFYHYTTRDGLQDNKVNIILPDKQGRLWISTDNGLSCFDTATRSFTNYTKDDGLINNKYNSGSACVDKDGWFYFGGMSGIDYFHPDSIDEQRPVPVLHLASFHVYDKEQPLRNSYKLATNENSIQLAFTANDFANASKLLFRYKLAGVDEKWMNMQGNNFALYSKLPHGKYRFRVMGSYNGRSWSKPLVIDFTIATPWFRSWWFYALLALATITGIYTFVSYRLQQKIKLQQQQLEKQQAVENIRSKISMDIHDEIGSQLTKISLLSQRIKIGYRKQKEVDEALINKITASSKEVVRNLGEIIWAVNPKHDNLQSLLAYLRNYIPDFFEQTNVDYAIDFPDEVPPITISPELKHNLFLVIKESLNNIVKHAAATEVKISFQFDGQAFCFEVADNGKGIADLNGRDFGNGFINMKNRMKAVNGKFEISSEINKGTNIQLKGTFSI